MSIYATRARLRLAQMAETCSVTAIRMAEWAMCAMCLRLLPLVMCLNADAALESACMAALADADSFLPMLPWENDYVYPSLQLGGGT